MAYGCNPVRKIYVLVVTGLLLTSQASAAPALSVDCVANKLHGLRNVYTQVVRSLKEKLGVPLSTRQKAWAFNSGEMKASGFFIENGVPGTVGGTFLKAGAPKGMREGASRTVLGSYVPYAKELRDLEVGVPPGGRYVSRGSLEQQLTYAEKKIDSLNLEKRPLGTRTFSYSNTVGTSNGNGLAWQGLNFRLEPNGETFKIRAHVRLLDPKSINQQEAIGLAGVNMVHGAYSDLAKLKDVTDPIARQKIMADFIKNLGDGFRNRRVEIDLIEFEGSIFKENDPRQIGFDLVKNGLTQHILFSPDGKIVPVYDSLYGKPIVSFYSHDSGYRPIADHVRNTIAQETGKSPNDIALIETVSLDDIKTHMQFDEQNFIEHTNRPNWVLISPDNENKLAAFLRSLNTGSSGIVAKARHPGLTEVVPIKDPSGKSKSRLRIYYGDPVK